MVSDWNKSGQESETTVQDALTGEPSAIGAVALSGRFDQWLGYALWVLLIIVVAWLGGF